MNNAGAEFFDPQGDGWSVIRVTIGELERSDERNREANYSECDDVEGAGQAENESVTETVIQQVPDQLSENDAAHRSAKANQTGDGSNCMAREDVCWQDHDEC